MLLLFSQLSLLLILFAIFCCCLQQSPSSNNNCNSGTHKSKVYAHINIHTHILEEVAVCGYLIEVCNSYGPTNRTKVAHTPPRTTPPPCNGAVIISNPLQLFLTWPAKSKPTNARVLSHISNINTCKHVSLNTCTHCHRTLEQTSAYQHPAATTRHYLGVTPSTFRRNVVMSLLLLLLLFLLALATANPLSLMCS